MAQQNLTSQIVDWINVPYRFILHVKPRDFFDIVHKKSNILRTILQVDPNYWADWTLWVWARDAEVAEGVLDEVRHQRFNSLHPKDQKNICPMVLSTYALQNVAKKKPFFEMLFLCWSCSGRARTWGKREEKSKRQKQEHTKFDDLRWRYKELQKNQRMP